MATEENDPFMKAVKGKYPMSKNMGAAANWLGADGVPRPDRELWLLRLLSVLAPGFDHFYLRSPLTGIPKALLCAGAIVCAVSLPASASMIPTVALGSWWLWDIAQVFTESDRVAMYGLSTLFDFHTGIGQGMITDRETAYTSDASFPLWLLGVVLGITGLDSFAAMNGGQGLRKILEGALFVLCAVTVANYANVSGVWGWIGWVFALIVGAYLSTIVIPGYIMVLTKVFGGNVFEDGIIFSQKQEDYYNALVRWMIEKAGYTGEDLVNILKDLEYGNMTAEELRTLFQIKHTKQVEAEAEAGAETGGSWMSFLILMISPFLILWNVAISKIVSGIEYVFAKFRSPVPIPQPMRGGAHPEPLSVDAQILGAVTIAVIAAGSLKGIVDYLMKE